MSLTLALVRSMVANRTGLTVKDMPDAVIDDCTVAALGEYFEHVPRQAYGLIDLVANTQDYEFPSGVLQINDLVIGDPYLIGTQFTDTDLATVLTAELININLGGDPFENPSLAPIMFQKIKALNDSFGPQWQIVGSGSEVRLRIIPPPSADGKAAYKGTKAWEVTDIQDSDSEHFMQAVLWKVCDARSMALAVVESISEAGGSSFTPAHKYWSDKSKEYQELFLGSSGAYAGGFLIG